MTIKTYKKEVAGVIPGIFSKRANFLRSFGTDLQVVTEKNEGGDDFLTLKIDDSEVVIGEYSKDPNVGMGTGTSKSSRFGELNEIKSINKSVPYDNVLKFNDAVDIHTVNDNYDAVVAKRFELNANSWAVYYDKVLSAYLEESAGKTLNEERTSEGVTKAFDKAYAEYINLDVTDVFEWVAYVKPEVMSLIVNSNLTGLEKRSSVDIDSNTSYKYKGFVLKSVGANKMTSDILFAPDNVGVAALGILTARTIPHPDFDGVAIQGTSSLGKYIPDENKRAIIKATLTEPLPKA